MNRSIVEEAVPSTVLSAWLESFGVVDAPKSSGVKRFARTSAEAATCDESETDAGQTTAHHEPQKT